MPHGNSIFWQTKLNEGGYDIEVVKSVSETFIAPEMFCQDECIVFLQSDQIDYVPYEAEFDISGGGRECHQIQLLNDMATEPTVRFTVSVDSSISLTGSQTTLVYIYDDDGEINVYNRGTNVHNRDELHG